MKYNGAEDGLRILVVITIAILLGILLGIGIGLLL